MLCSSNKDKLSWYPTYSATFAIDRLSGAVKPVEGGINFRENIIYVARVLDSSARIRYYGIVEDDNTVVYYSSSLKRGLYQNYYEVLVVNEKC